MVRKAVNAEVPTPSAVAEMMPPWAEEAVTSTGRRSLEYSLISVMVFTASPIRALELLSMSEEIQTAPTISAAAALHPMDCKMDTRNTQQKTAIPVFIAWLISA